MSTRNTKENNNTNSYKTRLVFYFLFTLIVSYLVATIFSSYIKIIPSRLKLIEGLLHLTTIILLLFSILISRNIRILKRKIDLKYIYLFAVILASSEISSIFFKTSDLTGELYSHILVTLSFCFLLLAFVNAYDSKYLDNRDIIVLRTILDTLNTPAFMIDESKKFIGFNKYFEDLMEMSYEELLNKDINYINNIIKFSDHKQVDEIYENNLNLDQFEATFITPKGNKRHGLVNISIMRDENGKVIGIITLLTDITKIKEEQQRLLLQEKRALLGQMGATILHETRNFLTTIKGSSQLIEVYSSNEKVKYYAKKINENTDEVNKLVSDFLNLSKPTEAEMVELSINDLISSMRSTLETSSLLKGVNVVFDLNHDERYILCNESQMKQVILNMCKNAVDAMCDVASPTLIIKTGLEEAYNRMFIKIIDNGSGIAKENLDKIGTPYFTTKITGTGLGLNSCFHIIKEHNGTIDIDSKIGCGTTFTIYIPFIEDDYQDYFLETLEADLIDSNLMDSTNLMN